MADVPDRTISCMAWKVLMIVPLTYSDNVHCSADCIEFYFLWLILHEKLWAVGFRAYWYIMQHERTGPIWLERFGGKWWSRLLDSSRLHSTRTVKAQLLVTQAHSTHKATLVNDTHDFPNLSRLLSNVCFSKDATTHIYSPSMLYVSSHSTHSMHDIHKERAQLGWGHILLFFRVQHSFAPTRNGFIFHFVSRFSIPDMSVYICESCPLARREEQRLRVFENRVLKTIVLYFSIQLHCANLT
jgi:hypothetical protein